MLGSGLGRSPSPRETLSQEAFLLEGWLSFLLLQPLTYLALRERVRKRKEAQVQGGQFAGRGEAGPQQEAEGWGQSKAKGDVNGDGG